MLSETMVGTGAMFSSNAELWSLTVSSSLHLTQCIQLVSDCVPLKEFSLTIPLL